ncbi:MAG: large conductance mechanosensitive channel protein MscL [Christensenellales bacterium]|nr:large conductance mechanosensitive channel protein MscL [Christensenellales bacterium]
MRRFIKEFKAFAFRGNVIDLAVGVMIGAAFNGIVSSIVDDLISPLIAWITGSMDFTGLVIPLGASESAPVIAIGSFLQTIINFFIIAFCIFWMVKFINSLEVPLFTQEPKKPVRKCPFCRSVIDDEATRCPHCTSSLE